MANGDGFMVHQPCAISHKPLAMTCSRPPIAILFSHLTNWSTTPPSRASGRC